MNKYAIVNTLFSAVGGAIIGGAIGILVTKKHYEAYADTEIEKVRRHYALLRKDDNTLGIFGDLSKDVADEIAGPQGDPGSPFDPKNVTAETVRQMIGDLGYEDDGRQVDEDTSGEGEPVSIFDRGVDASEVGPELTGRDGNVKIVETPDMDPQDPMDGYVRYSGQPYIISQDEFYNTETEWEKASLAFYEGDGVLIDERDKPTDDPEGLVGTRHLEMFGVLSEDVNLVYVRNAQLSCDFEILRELGKYTVRVLGEPDYEAVEKQKLRRMRDSD